MISTILKITIFSVITLVVLKVFIPNTASKVISTISETTGIEKRTINENLDKIINLITDSADSLKEITTEAIEVANDKIKN